MTTERAASLRFRLSVGVLLAVAGCAQLRPGSDVARQEDAGPAVDSSVPVAPDAHDDTGPGVDPPEIDAAPACSPLASGSPVVYVDASAAAGGTGAAGCPLRTITSALAAAKWSPLTIQVAAGTYDALLGEQFPLMLRGGVTLQGAGADATIVQGLGAYTPPNFAGDQYCSFSTALVVGDDTAVTTIASLGIRSGSVTPARCTWGVYCARGNAALADAAATAANTIVDHVAFSGTEFGAVAGHDSTAPSGCNMRVASSQFRDALNGIWAFGYSPALPVSLDVEDSSFTRMASDGDPGRGFGVSVWDNASHVTILRSSFTNENSGVALTQGYQTTAQGYNQIVLDGNTFASLSDYGIYLGWSAQIASLEDNSFTSVSGAAIDGGAPGVALYLFDHGDPAGYYPRVLKARRNTFVGNDIGIELDANTANASALPSDFGTASDPGNNEFRCNSAPAGSGRVGYDVGLSPGVAGVSGVLSFAGNAWDVTPPIQGAPGGAKNGVDVETPSAGDVNVSAARVSAIACPPGRTP